MRAALAAFFLVVATGAGAQTDGIEPGLWRVSSRQGENGPLRLSQRCLTAEQAGNLAATFGPQFGGVNTACEQAETRAGEGKVAWRLQCRGQVDIDVGAEFIFRDRRHYSATILTKTSVGGAPAMGTATLIEGEYVGACP